jgi:hypothetical protein
MGIYRYVEWHFFGRDKVIDEICEATEQSDKLLQSKSTARSPNYLLIAMSGEMPWCYHFIDEQLLKYGDLLCVGTCDHGHFCHRDIDVIFTGDLPLMWNDDTYDWDSYTGEDINPPGLALLHPKYSTPGDEWHFFGHDLYMENIAEAFDIDYWSAESDIIDPLTGNRLMQRDVIGGQNHFVINAHAPDMTDEIAALYPKVIIVGVKKTEIEFLHLGKRKVISENSHVESGTN